jgi:hypothetical protein
MGASARDAAGRSLAKAGKGALVALQHAVVPRRISAAPAGLFVAAAMMACKITAAPTASRLSLDNPVVDLAA